jgi:dTMP kinase
VLNGPEMAPWAEAAIFAAARAEHAAEVIRPALARGADVVCDRFVDSSLAYQGIARGLGLERVLELNLTVLEGLLPDRTFVVALEAEAAAARRKGEPDRIEQAGDGFQAEVGRAYEQLAELFPERVELLDGAQPAAEIAAEVRRRLGL